mmetsp:Transcript_34396/g.69450  ORF Transcript_34396/g.69450 Transcript_34396/m.69450 type:complete len:539 (-) Transcript_34396:3704-5320(-)
MAARLRWKNRLSIAGVQAQQASPDSLGASISNRNHSMDDGDEEAARRPSTPTEAAQDEPQNLASTQRAGNSSRNYEYNSTPTKTNKKGHVNFMSQTNEGAAVAVYPNGVEEYSDDDDEDSFDLRKQFTVTSIKTHDNCCRRAFDWFAPNVDENVYTPNAYFCRYINWTFRAGFIMVFVTFLMFFMVLTVTFGWFLQLAGNAEPGCIVVAGEPFGTNPDTTLADAYGLSWTTFTTVGYGALYTATGNDFDPQKKCWVVNALCTTESFVGLLYAGMCAAILFGKIGRVQSHAQVQFSDAICITYGDGSDVLAAAPPERRELATPNIGAEGEGSTDGHRIACPVMQFQVINSLCNERGGEIMDAQLKLVAANNRKAGADEPTMAMYRKVTLTEFEHPFFSRVWHGRHILDANSPLLNKFARSMIKRNGGYWPADWNNPNDIRNALRFTDLIVTLTGISNVSASTVHAYKRFKYGDLLVGYEFASTLYTNPGSTKLMVDHTLINDVIEQEGGGAEAFDDKADEEDEYVSWGRSVHIEQSGRP